MDNTVLREFLIKLGVKTDEAALKKFNDGIDTATRSVFKLASAVTATSVIVAAAVSRYASNLEQLYFASKRTNSAAGNLRAFDKAAQDFGAQAGAATASVEALAQALRMNPGNEAYLDFLLNKVGERARDANGHLRDMTAILTDLGKTFANEPMFVAEQQASQFGIDEATMMALRNGKFADVLKEYQGRMDNPALQRAVTDAHRFQGDMRDLELVLEQFGAKAEDAILKRFGGSAKSLADWMQQHGDQLVGRLIEGINKVIDLVERLKPVVSWVIQKFQEADKATDGWSTRLLLIAGALQAVGAAGVIAGVLGLAGAFVSLGTAIAGATGNIPALLALTGIGAGGYAAYKGLKGEDASNPISKWLEKQVGSIGAGLYDLTHRNETAQQFFQGRGWSPAQTAGIVANLMAESGFRTSAKGDNGHAYGIAQWHEDRQASFKRLFGFDIHGSSFMQQLQFVDYELRNGAERRAGAMLRAATNARQAGEIVSRYYEAPADKDGQAARRGQLAVNLTMNTDIHNHGVSDPKKASDRTARDQDRASAAAVRNLAAVLQ